MAATNKMNTNETAQWNGHRRDQIEFSARVLAALAILGLVAGLVQAWSELDARPGEAKPGYAVEGDTLLWWVGAEEPRGMVWRYGPGARRVREGGER